MDLIGRYNSPHRLHLETTKKCNLCCEHCYVSADDTYSHYELSKIKASISLAKEKGAIRLTLTGGEFLMRRDYKDIVEYAVDIGYRNIYFITNGILLNKKILDWLAGLKVRNCFKTAFKTMFGKIPPITIGIAISIDGLKGNDLIRTKKSGGYLSYNETLNKIKMATRYGLYVTVNTTISNSITAAELPILYKLLLEYKVDRWQIDQVFLSGRCSTSDKIEHQDEWIHIVKDSYKEIVKDYIARYPSDTKMKLEIVQCFRSAMLDHGFDFLDSDRVHPCAYQFGSIIVEGEGDVRFCPSLRNECEGIFNLNDKPISAESYLLNDNFKKFATLKISDLPCVDCRYKYISHGGCRGNSVSFNDNLMTKDPICCELSPFIESDIISLFPKELQNEYNRAIYKQGKHPEKITNF